MHLFLPSKACIFYPKRHKTTYSVRNIFTVASPRSCLCTLPSICDALVMGSELFPTLGLGLGQYSNCLKILLQEKSKKFNTSLNQVLGEGEIPQSIRRRLQESINISEKGLIILLIAQHGDQNNKHGSSVLSHLQSHLCPSQNKFYENSFLDPQYQASIWHIIRIP